MAGPNAAYASNVEVATDTAGTPGTYSSVGLQSKCTIGLKAEQIDVTQLNSAGYRMRLPGLLDGTGKLTAFESYGDAGQTIIRTAVSNRSRYWIKGLLNDSTHYIALSVLPQKLSLSTEPSKAVPIDFPFILDGTPASPVTIA
jgi:hypothetical protein